MAALFNSVSQLHLVSHQHWFSWSSNFLLLSTCTTLFNWGQGLSWHPKWGTDEIIAKMVNHSTETATCHHCLIIGILKKSIFNWRNSCVVHQVLHGLASSLPRPFVNKGSTISTACSMRGFHFLSDERLLWHYQLGLLLLYLELNPQRH